MCVSSWRRVTARLSRARTRRGSCRRERRVRCDRARRRGPTQPVTDGVGERGEVVDGFERRRVALGRRTASPARRRAHAPCLRDEIDGGRKSPPRCARGAGPKCFARAACAPLPSSARGCVIVLQRGPKVIRPPSGRDHGVFVCWFEHARGQRERAPPVGAVDCGCSARPRASMKDSISAREGSMSLTSRMARVDARPDAGAARGRELLRRLARRVIDGDVVVRWKSASCESSRVPTREAVRLAPAPDRTRCARWRRPRGWSARGCHALTFGRLTSGPTSHCTMSRS